jgi:hypothetical protein
LASFPASFLTLDSCGRVMPHLVFPGSSPQLSRVNVVLPRSELERVMHFNYEKVRGWGMLSLWTEKHIPAMSLMKNGPLPRPT